jgi:hypothetical protein
MAAGRRGTTTIRSSPLRIAPEVGRVMDIATEIAADSAAPVAKGGTACTIRLP